MYVQKETVRIRLKRVFQTQGIFTEELLCEEEYELDSLSFVYLMVAIEEEFGIQIDERLIEKVIEDNAVLSLEKCEELVNKSMDNKTE